MRRIDIRQVKKDLRDKFKGLRRAMSPEQKAEADHRIRNRVFSTYQYKGAAMLLTYVSTAIEVDTKKIIRQAWEDGKIVCVPRCREGERLMDFYEITSFDQLEKGAFGVLEPIPEQCRKVTQFDDSLCIVPGLGFDHFGFRLGYGKGYYDRFLSRYDGFKVGICYNECISHRLPRGRYDVPIDLLATPRFLKRPFRA
ncbi:MAG: 5-formyltetrahydrofolate cyclo-ligase [Oscillospiraceae bacterium]|jgi:5-formyltetrahydrofolate cyclo-ligase|nr:5-formyltetrahydrofolate cyclo-ligase [Oscillospiraceae bacterium]